MNYWKQFAEMLGLELGQEFVLIDIDGEIKDKDTYKITENGLRYKRPSMIDWFHEPSDTIESILHGNYKAVPKSWKPKNDETYWWYSMCSKTSISGIFTGSTSDLIFWKAGNCFKTEKDANEKGKEIMEQIKKEYEEE